MNDPTKKKGSGRGGGRGIKKKNEEFNKKFQISLGRYYAGKDSPEIKNQLKRYIRRAMSESLINTKDGLNLLYELS